jgi:CDP-4-dehydro-6-deoxyglucose reductase
MSPRVHFAGTPYDLLPGETLLAGLARQGVMIPSFCRTGVCQTCLVRATSGQPPRQSQAGVADALVQRGCFLACQCVPDGPLEVEPSDLEVPEGFEFRAGQFVQLEREGGVTRPFSIASLPGSGHIELHVLLRPGGLMSQWLRWAENQPITLRGPFGECFYFENEPERPLLLAGTGTGLAPLLGVTRAALAAGHRGPIHLYHGSTTRDGLYLFDELRALTGSAPRLRVFGSVLSSAGEPAGAARDAADGGSRCVLHHEALDKLILGDSLDFFQCRVYLCGDPELVQRMRKRIYLSGAPQGRIHCDPFVAPAE